MVNKSGLMVLALTAGLAWHGPALAQNAGPAWVAGKRPIRTASIAPSFDFTDVPPGCWLRHDTCTGRE